MKYTSAILPSTKGTPHDPESAYELLCEIRKLTSDEMPDRYARLRNQGVTSTSNASALGKLYKLWHTPDSRNVGAALALALPLGEPIQVQMESTTRSLVWKGVSVPRTKNPVLDVLAVIKAAHTPGNTYLDPTLASPWMATRPHTAGNFQAMFGAAQLLHTPWLRFDPKLSARTSYEITRLCMLGEIESMSAFKIGSDDVIVDPLKDATLTFHMA